MKHLPLFNDRFALIDDDVFEKAKSHKWYLDSVGYPARSVYNNATKKTTAQRLHVFLLGPSPKGRVTDHKNDDKLDNRRENLRFVTSSLNVRKGRSSRIYRHENGKSWSIEIRHAGKKLYFGKLETEDEARSIAHLLKGSLIYHELTKGDSDG